MRKVLRLHLKTIILREYLNFPPWHKARYRKCSKRISKSIYNLWSRRIQQFLSKTIKNKTLRATVQEDLYLSCLSESLQLSSTALATLRIKAVLWTFSFQFTKKFLILNWRYKWLTSWNACSLVPLLSELKMCQKDTWTSQL